MWNALCLILRIKVITHNNFLLIWSNTLGTWIQIIYTFTFLFYGPAILKSGVFGLHCHTGMIIRLPTLGERKTAQIFCFPAFF